MAAAAAAAAAAAFFSSRSFKDKQTGEGQKPKTVSRAFTPFKSIAAGYSLSLSFSLSIPGLPLVPRIFTNIERRREILGGF